MIRNLLLLWIWRKNNRRRRGRRKMEKSRKIEAIFVLCCVNKQRRLKRSEERKWVYIGERKRERTSNKCRPKIWWHVCNCMGEWEKELNIHTHRLTNWIPHLLYFPFFFLSLFFNFYHFWLYTLFLHFK